MISDERLERYEGLVHATMRRWRKYITPDLTDEDVKQELRIKVWRALVSFDPERGYPEERHVFGAVYNRAKDLMNKRWRPEMHSGLEENDKRDILRHMGSWESSSSSVMPNLRYKQYDQRRTDALNGLPVKHQQVVVSLTAGFNAKETRAALDMKPAEYQRIMREVRVFMDEHRPKG